MNYQMSNGHYMHTFSTTFIKKENKTCLKLYKNRLKSITLLTFKTVLIQTFSDKSNLNLLVHKLLKCFSF